MVGYKKDKKIDTLKNILGKGMNTQFLNDLFLQRAGSNTYLQIDLGVV